MLNKQFIGNLQLVLLYLCLLYRPKISPENLGVSMRSYAFWQRPTYSQHLEFLAGLVCVLSFLVASHLSLKTQVTNV